MKSETSHWKGPVPLSWGLGQSCWIPIRRDTADYAEIYVSEDTSYDPETAHGDEAVAYLAIEGSGLLHGSNVRKYYAADGARVALRDNGSLYWLLPDHLGSTFRVAKADGTPYSGLLYKAWGEQRSNPGVLPTTFRYTGQRQEPLLGGNNGLYYYGARWYDTIVSRFIQPDTLIPDPYHPVDWDRYAYARNNPVAFIDPSGHYSCNPKDCGYMHDYDDDRPAPEWLIISSLVYLNSQLNNNPPTTNSKNVANVSSKVALGADILGALLSDIEAIATDVWAAGTISSGCATGVGCAPAIITSGFVDIYIASASPLALPENGLGFIAFAATAVSDVFSGNTGPTENGFVIGKDTLVAGRNFIAGLLPESNWDAAVSNSQLLYDLDRLLDNKPGGSIPISDVPGILIQFFFEDWW